MQRSTEKPAELASMGLMMIQHGEPEKDDLYLHISVALWCAWQLVRIHTHTKSGNEFPGMGTEVINNKVSFIL